MDTRQPVRMAILPEKAARYPDAQRPSLIDPLHVHE
jgi:hypothetical protein